MLRESKNTFQEIITQTDIGTYSIKTHICRKKKSRSVLGASHSISHGLKMAT